MVNDPAYRVYAGDVEDLGDQSGSRTRVGMGWQDLLKPSGTTQFIPDERVWAILYSWRMPGFETTIAPEALAAATMPGKQSAEPAESGAT